MSANRLRLAALLALPLLAAASPARAAQLTPGATPGRQLQASAWEARDPGELRALRALASDPAYTAPGWSVAAAAEAPGNLAESPVTLRATKQLPAEPLAPSTVTREVIDHYVTVPAHVVPAEVTPVYRTEEVETPEPAQRR